MKIDEHRERERDTHTEPFETKKNRFSGFSITTNEEEEEEMKRKEEWMCFLLVDLNRRMSFNDFQLEEKDRENEDIQPSEMFLL